MSLSTGVSKQIVKWPAAVVLLVFCAVLVWAQDKKDTAAGTSPLPPPDKSGSAVGTYVGPAACKGCHSKVWEPFSTSAHGKTLARDSLAPELHGCEACHGPASAHVGSPGQNKPRILRASDAVDVVNTCGTCHLRSDSSKAPSEWQSISSIGYRRSAHGRKGISCLTCHTGHVNGNERALVKPAAELCASCHASVLEASPGKKAGYTHSPVAQGQCLTCHDPHGGRSRGMLVENVQAACLTCHNASDPALTTAHRSYPLQEADCLSCHDPHSHDQAGKQARGVRHQPFAQGNCDVCHTKAASGDPAGLTKPANELCFMCHAKSKLMPEGEKAHPPVANGLCLSCHDPHTSNHKKLLKSSQPANSCFACHSKIEADTVKAHRHKVLEGNLNCLLCHKPHSSRHEGLLVKDQTALCTQCHKHSWSHPMGKKADGSPVISPLTKQPMACSDCHELHGSDFERMTRGDKSRDLCIHCHKMGHST